MYAYISCLFGGSILFGTGIPRNTRLSIYLAFGTKAMAYISQH